MKGLLLLLFAASVVALMLFSFSRIERTPLFPGSTLTHYGDEAAVIRSSRKLKEMTRPSTIAKRSEKSVSLDDYLPIDPAPNSKASIRPGPIEHDTPLMPFFPKSPPPIPNPPKDGP